MGFEAISAFGTRRTTSNKLPSVGFTPGFSAGGVEIDASIGRFSV